MYKRPVHEKVGNVKMSIHGPTSRTANCKISFLFFSPPENPSFTLRFRKVGSMLRSSSCEHRDFKLIMISPSKARKTSQEDQSNASEVNAFHHFVL